MNYEKEEIQKRLSEQSSRGVRTGPSYIKLSYIFSLLMCALGIGLAEYRNSMLMADPFKPISDGLAEVRSYDNYSEKTTLDNNRLTVEMSGSSTQQPQVERVAASISTSMAQTAVPIILIFLSIFIACVTSVVAVVKMRFFRGKNAT